MYEVTADLIQFLSNLHLFGVSILSQPPSPSLKTSHTYPVY